MALNGSPDNHWEGDLRVTGALEADSLAVASADLTSLSAESVSISDVLHLAVLAGDPVAPVDGDIWRTAAGIRAKIGTAVGTLDFTADP